MDEYGAFGGETARLEWYRRRRPESESYTTGYDDTYNEKSEYVDIAPLAKLVINRGTWTFEGATANMYDFDSTSFLTLTNANDVSSFNLLFDLLATRNIKGYMFSIIPNGSAFSAATWRVRLQVSDDAITFTTLDDQSGSADTQMNFSSGSFRTRFFRILGETTAIGGPGFSLRIQEFHIST